MRSTSLLAVASVAWLATASCLAAPKPHVVYVLADDFGWNDADWHAHTGSETPTHSTDPPATPFLSSLVRAGVELDHRTCR